MVRLKRIVEALLFALAFWGPAQADEPLSPPWKSYVTLPGAYQLGSSNVLPNEGKSCAFIRSQKDVGVKVHALIYQAVSSGPYRGGKLTLKGFLRTREVQGWAGLWVRAEDAQGRVLSFQNMMDRPVRGSTEWSPYQVGIDLPVQTAKVVFGALLVGQGEVWVDRLSLEGIGPERAIEKLRQKIRSLPEKATNLGFEE